MSRAHRQPTALDFSDPDDEALRALLREHNLSLTPGEARQIQDRILGRPPTLAECVLWSIQGSEHCSYKSSRPHLERFVTGGPGVILGPSEDAGVVELARDRDGRRYGLAASHESHNHPSQVVPCEGAATGVGGNVRDVCCMGAKVVAVGDSLRFGDPGIARSKWIHEGVVAGIAGYGNPLGIPNLCGDVYYDPGYNDNCLVTVLTLGAVAEEGILHSYAPADAEGHALVLVGKPTDNSGFGGASFASGELDENEREKNKGAVQEPNAFLERHLLKATYDLHRRLADDGHLARVGFKDLGAGGIACASVELADAAGYGAEVRLEEVPVGMEDLPPHVILCSETQERFLWVAPDDLVPVLLEHYNERFALPEVSSGARAAVIGRIRGDGRYRVTWRDEVLVDAPAAEVTKGLVYDREFRLPESPRFEPGGASVSAGDPGRALLELLADPNIASRKPVYECYDKQVQGATTLEAGRGDAGVFRPFADPVWPEEIRGIGAAASLDQNPRYNRIDPGLGAAWAVVEAYRNVCAVGARPVAFTDCLCYGNPEKPEQMGEFVAGVRGVAAAARALHPPDHPGEPVPVIAGNVSLYNESQGRAIPPSPMIACIGRLPEAEKAVGFGFRRPGSAVCLIGEPPSTLAGSLFLERRGGGPSGLPEPDYAAIGADCAAVLAGVEAGRILSCHDVSDGGTAVALAEAAIDGGLGLEATEANLPTEALFGEFGGFVAEIAPDRVEETRTDCAERSVPFATIGTVRAEGRFRLGPAIDLPLEEIARAWNDGLREALE